MAVWFSGPLIFIAVLTAIAVSGRLLGVTSPVFGAIAPSIAFTIAWTAWWPILKPKTGFWQHTAIGLVTAVLVVAVAILLSDSRP
jgi:hypothetical protein